ncbi:Cytochrome c oxidase assembly protein cox19 [Basidiobolus ranarum]|uniref:Cytochrome c oxidase assembly protein COX19 n=1 Tax=Basidiobolus ranarum TaxID=34480 RepID=A0ABR2W1V8_9FUNG
MSFGGPPNTFSFNASPPDRGSFPLDHEGECKEAMMEYMECLKQNKAVNGACRDLSKAYLKCRMERDLMTKDDFKNLGFTSESDS